MKLIPAAGFALVLAAAPCFAPLAFAPSAIAQGLSGDAARAAAATQYLASAATSNFQASQLAAIPHPPRESDACPGGAQEALQHQIETLMAGSPDYDAMAPSVANQWRNEIDKLGPVTRQWGALIALKQYPKLWGTSYEAQFEHARVQWKIACKSSYGKITGISFKTLS